MGKNKKSALNAQSKSKEVTLIGIMELTGKLTRRELKGIGKDLQKIHAQSFSQGLTHFPRKKRKLYEIS
jgi:hypothetical protein